MRDTPLIIGGNTTPVIDALIATGANNLLCDFSSDWPTWLEGCRKDGRAVRRNLAPQLVQNGSEEEIYQAARAMISEAGDYPGFIAGTAVVPFGTPTRNLLVIRRACKDSA